MANEEIRTNGFDPDQLMDFVRRIERIQDDLDTMAAQFKDECAPLKADIAAVKTEAADAGIGKKEFAAIIKRRRHLHKADHVVDKLDLGQRAFYEQMIESLERLAEQVGPLGEAALERARAI
jgi:uncharacterized protein (UPF0335 family)